MREHRCLAKYARLALTKKDSHKKMIEFGTDAISISAQSTWSYAVEIHRDDLATLQVGGPYVLFTTPTVHRLYRHDIDSLLASQAHGTAVVVEVTEQSKSIEKVRECLKRATDLGIGRNGTFIAFGGGVLSDVVGVASALYRRGIRLIRVPTTLLAQVDAAVGIKCAVNLEDNKNHIGFYYPPAMVSVNPGYLISLPAEELSSGFAEMIKMGLFCDARLLEILRLRGLPWLHGGARDMEASHDIMVQAIRPMLEAIECNPGETRPYARTVDGGHNIGPYLEAAHGFRLRHGFAVALDMVLSSALAVSVGRLSVQELRLLIEFFRSAGLPTKDKAITTQLVLRAAAELPDQRGGRLDWPIPGPLGSTTFLQRADFPSARVLNELLDAIGEDFQK